MLIAILSDIHSNFRALEAVLDDIDSCSVEEIISLGDNIGYGPEPEEVIKTLQKRNILSVMGNHELALAKPSYLAGLNPDAKISLELQLQMISSASISYCTALPKIMIRHGARFIHGCPPRSLTSYLYYPSMKKMKRIFAGYPERFCFFGHLHSFERYILANHNCSYEQPVLGSYQCTNKARYLLNPGSVGQPRDGINRKAKYGLWDVDADTFELRAVPYDSATTKKLLRQHNFPEMNSARL